MKHGQIGIALSNIMHGQPTKGRIDEAKSAIDAWIKELEAELMKAPMLLALAYAANFVKNSKAWPSQTAQPWSLGAVTSRPSFESSLRAIRRIRPSARKMRRRLTALAGATDNSITNKDW